MGKDYLKDILTELQKSMMNLNQTKTKDCLKN